MIDHKTNVTDSYTLFEKSGMSSSIGNYTVQTANPLKKNKDAQEMSEIEEICHFTDMTETPAEKINNSDHNEFFRI